MQYIYESELISAFEDNVSVYDVLAKGLQDLQDACDVVLDKFVTARDEFVASQKEVA